MLLLSGPENLELRRVPRVSLGIMLGCAVFSMLGGLFASFSEAAPEAARDYLARHGYLNASDRMWELIRQDAELEKFSQMTIKPPEDMQQRVMEQSQMDILSLNAEGSFQRSGVHRMGFRPADPGFFSFFLHMFYHNGLFHLIGALLLFYMTGPYLEDVWGRVFFPVFFVASGLVAALGYMGHYTFSYAPIHGATGAVAAVIGAYLVRFHKTRIRFIYMVQILKKDTYGPSLVLIPLWFLFQLPMLWAWENNTMYNFNGWWPQLYGFVFGVTVALVIKFCQLESLLYQSPFEKLPEEEQLAIIATRLRSEGKTEALLEHLANAWRKYPGNDEFTSLYWNQAVRMDNTAGAMGAAKKMIDTLLLQQAYDRAYFHWRELHDRHPQERLTPNQIETLAHGLLSVGHQVDATYLMQASLKDLPANLSEEALFALLEAGRFADPKLALACIEKILQEGLRPKREVARLKELREEILTLYPQVKEPIPEKKEIEISQLEVNLENDAVDEDPFAPSHVAALQVYRGVPKILDDGGLHVLLDGQEQTRLLKFSQIKGISVAAIRPYDGKPTLVLDLLTDNPFDAKPMHRLVRLEGNRFDPLALMPDEESPAEAVRQLMARVIDRAQPETLPDKETLLAARFPKFRSVASYERAVYGVASNHSG